ncbi:hypothetical protein [Pseudomonas sp. MWU12-3103b]|uniref:hypothetical protein n=1 Tax=Pseudomonas sp. MWU12-3103b TaxID=2928857 RepID=UPI001FFEC10C|nr:hypothetical protein [Pseudomonas sp. MWU12-3103b]
MSTKKNLHSTKFDDDKRNGWGIVGEHEFGELVKDESRGIGKCLATTVPNVTNELDFYQRSVEDFKNRKLIVSFDLRVDNVPDTFRSIDIHAGGSKRFSVQDPKPNDKWQRYSIPVDLTGLSFALLDIEVDYSNISPTSRAFIDNILIEADD